MYKVGDICIGVNFVNQTHFNGMECVIKHGNKERTVRHYVTGKLYKEYGYLVEWENGERCSVAEYKLKLKRPPEEPSSWEKIKELCGFHPAKVKELM